VLSRAVAAHRGSPGYIRREIAETDEAREVGPLTPSAGRVQQRPRLRLGECRVEPARLRSSFTNRAFGFAWQTDRAVDHHSDLAGAAQPCRYGQKLGFLIAGALR